MFTLRADWPSGCSGEVLAGSTSKKKCPINWRWRPTKEGTKPKFKRARDGKQRREDKGGWEKLEKNLTVRLLLPASLTIEHVAYEHYSKIPGHP